MKKTILLAICILMLNGINAQKANHKIEARKASDTSINIQNLTDLDIVIYPNPVVDVLKIKSKSVIDNISVYNDNGLLVIKFDNINTFETSISFNLFRSGLYFIVIDSKTFKVIKI